MMKRWTVIITLMLAGFFPGPSPAEEIITLSSLLEDLADPMSLLEPADYTAGMISTWDRTGGNDDGYNFLDYSGDTVTLVDLPGPGVITRIFCATPGGLVSIYLDYNEKPIFSEPGQNLFRGIKEPFLKDLVDCKAGCYSYLPLPFQERIVIKIKNQLSMDPSDKGHGAFWQVSYRLYPKHKEVVSLSLPLTIQERELIMNSGKWMSDQGKGAYLEDSDIMEVREELKPGASLEIFNALGPGIIRAISTDLRNNQDKKWENLVIRMYWDGEDTPSVECPLGFLLWPNRGWFLFPLPYDQARIELLNDGPEELGPYNFNIYYQETPSLPSDLRFHALYNQAWTEALNPGPNLSAQNNYHLLDIEAQGLYIGTILRVYNVHYIWWGEGDEMIFVDSDAWPPAFHGTGTEDYFDGAWKQLGVELFSGYIYKNTMKKHFAGDNLLYRWHVADPIPFYKSISVSFEHGYLTNELANFYASASLWYQPEPHPPKGQIPGYSSRVLDENYMKSLINSQWWRAQPWIMKAFYIGAPIALLFALFLTIIIAVKRSPIED